MSHLNKQIQDALNNFDTRQAQELLQEALQDPNAETYYLAAIATEDRGQRKSYLQKAIELNPYHEKAHTELNKLGVSDVSSIAMPEADANPQERKSKNPFVYANRYGLVATISGIGLLIGYFLPFATERPFFFLEFLDIPRSMNFFFRFSPYNDLEQFIFSFIRGFDFPNLLRIYVLMTILIPIFGILIILQSHLGSRAWDRIRFVAGIGATAWLIGTLIVGIMAILFGEDFIRIFPYDLERAAAIAGNMVLSGYGFWLCIVFLMIFGIDRFRSN